MLFARVDGKDPRVGTAFFQADSAIKSDKWHRTLEKKPLQSGYGIDLIVVRTTYINNESHHMSYPYTFDTTYLVLDTLGDVLRVGMYEWEVRALCESDGSTSLVNENASPNRLPDTVANPPMLSSDEEIGHETSTVTFIVL